MDPTSGGASVIAFVTLALQSTKTLYQAISAIKRAPKWVKDTASSIKDLSLVLEQLENTQAITQNNSNGLDLTAIESTMKKCVDDITRFEEDLKKLQSSHTGKKWGR